jgi:hypothetical protein
MRSSSARFLESRASVSGPLVAEHLDPQRVGQMHPGAARLQQVSRPGPAVGRLEHDLRVGAGLGQLQRQPDRVVVDPDGLQHLASGVMRTITERRRCKSIPTQVFSHGPPSSWLV